MIDKKLSFVTTSINKPTFLEDYIQNGLKHGHKSDTFDVIVIGDLKTPVEVREYCNKLQADCGVEVVYLGVEDQIEWLSNNGLTELDRILPYNSIQRRNIGYLYACTRGTEVIVSLDDDNLAGDDDILTKFGTVGEVQTVLEVKTANGWFNPASMLTYENESSRDVYHRGYPYSKRDSEQEFDFEVAERKVMIRAGLWTEVPDIDVITHLERNPRATGIKEEYVDTIVGLGDGIFAPVNTQNTAFHTDLMPLIYAIPMGDTVDGMEISRYDDIWLGYFAEKVMHAVSGTVAYGTPVSTHDRNVHNLYSELEHEAIGVRLNEIAINMMSEAVLENVSYATCYLELIQKSRDIIEQNIPYQYEAYFKEMLDRMEVWTLACEKSGVISLSNE